MVSTTLLPGTMFRGTQLISRPSHVCVRPQILIIFAVAKPTKATGIRGKTAGDFDKKVHARKRDLMNTGQAQKSIKTQSRKSVANEETRRPDPRAQQRTTTTTKLCRSCKEWKDVNSSKASGIDTICRPCHAKRARERWQNLGQRKKVQIPEKKWCPGCLEKRPASVFCLDSGRLDGLQSICKDCKALSNQKYRAEKKMTSG